MVSRGPTGYDACGWGDVFVVDRDRDVEGVV